MATIFKLIIEDDEGKTTVYPLADGDISIGRKEGNTIRLMERNVSRRHAKLLRNNGAVFIEDLDSYNGIKINGERIAGRYEVKEGDLVEIGDYHLALQRTEMEDAEESAAPSHARAQTEAGFQLPREMVQQGEQASSRDTIIDQPAPAQMPAAVPQTMDPPAAGGGEPLVKPPPRGEPNPTQELPPFPTPGGLPPPKPPFGGDATAPERSEPKQELTVGPSVTSTVPRLICVSTGYAGKEFALTRPELIIGRVEDNDIVIEHRSVSRNHAKILFDGRTHKIIDLQSANGILVNGEEYAMTDLRKGDLIELGHVRFRFIPANEAFAPTDEEAQEMREAGVEPPSAQSAPAAPAAPAAAGPSAEVAMGYDPSTAATVTDTPLDALGMSDLMSPRVNGNAAERAPAKPSNGQTSPQAEPIKRAVDDQRPTEINTVQKSGRTGPTSAPSAGVQSAAAISTPPKTKKEEPRTHKEDVDHLEAAIPAPRPAKRSPNPLLWVFLAMCLIALVLGGMLLIGGDEGLDGQLADLHQVGKWDQVVLLYEEHPGEFEDARSALQMYKDASRQLATDEPPLDDAVEPPPGDAVPEDPEPIPEVEEPEARTPEPEPEPEPEVEPDPDADRTAQARARRRARAARRRTRPRGPSQEQLNKWNLEAVRLMNEGRLSAAEDILERCVNRASRFGPCYRSLGILYAQMDDTQRSVESYRRYLQLTPDATDAESVRRMIERVEQPPE